MGSGLTWNWNCGKWFTAAQLEGLMTRQLDLAMAKAEAAGPARRRLAGDDDTHPAIATDARCPAESRTT
jgi:hypothetical protein